MRHTRSLPKGGDRRVRHGFLFFPKTIKNSSGEVEWRWLEHAAWTEQFYSHYGAHGFVLDYWAPVEWNEPEVNKSSQGSGCLD